MGNREYHTTEEEEKKMSQTNREVHVSSLIEVKLSLQTTFKFLSKIEFIWKESCF